MKNPKFACIVMGAIVLAASACGKKNATEIDGTWTSNCYSAGTGVGYSESTWEFSGDEFTRKDKVFTDSDCSTESFTAIREGTFKLGDAVGTPEGAKKIDVKITKAEIIANSDERARDFNARTYCGITGWSEGSEKDILGKNCDNTQVDKDQVFYSIYKVDKSVSPHVFSEGDESQAGATLESDATRPTRLSTAVIYTSGGAAGFNNPKRGPHL